MTRGLESPPLVVRERCSAGPERPCRIRVIVRAAGNQKTERTRTPSIMRACRVVMIGVEDFKGVEAGLSKRRNPVVDLSSRRVRERDEPTGAVDDRNDACDRRPGSWHERGTIPSEPAFERLSRILDVPGCDHRARDLRPANRPGGPEPRFRDERLDVDRHPQRRKPRSDRFDSRQPRRTLPGQKID